MLFAPSDRIAITAAVDHTRQRPEGYAQVVAGVAPTLRPANRQYAQIAADLGYTPPSFNAFDRLTDIDTPWQSNQDLGGASLTVDWNVGPGRLTSTTAWRYWNWDPSNDRDFIGLPVTTISAAPSKQRQWTQEVRYAGDRVSPHELRRRRLRLPPGASTPTRSFKQEQGAAAARFLLAPSAAAATPGLLDGYGFNQYLKYRNVSAALFGQLEWSVTDRLRLLARPAVQLRPEETWTSTSRSMAACRRPIPRCIALQRSVLAPQAYAADVDDTNLSGQLTVAYKVARTRQRLCDLCDRLQVGRPQPERRAHRRVGPARPLRRDGETRGRASRRSRREDRAASRGHGERHRLRHRDQGLPDAGRERAGGRASRLSRQRRKGARARRRVRRQRPGEQAGSRSTGPPPTPTASTSPSRTRRRRSRTPAGRRSRTSRAPCCLASRSGRSRSAASTTIRRRVLGQAGSSSVRSTPAIAPRSRRAHRLRSTWWSTAMACSTPGSASGGRMAGSLSSGRATCWTRTTSSCSRPQPGNSGLYVGLPGDPRTVGVTLRMSFRSVK